MKKNWVYILLLQTATEIRVQNVSLMKVTKLLLLALFLISGLSLYSQKIAVTDGISITNRKISYSNDNSGNRTIRFNVPTTLLKAGATDEKETVVTEKISLNDFKAGIRIYPNPTEGRFVVEIINVPDKISGEMYLYDTQGGLLKKENILSEKRIDFDLSRYAAGIYVLNIRLGEEISTWKIIKK